MKNGAKSIMEALGGWQRLGTRAPARAREQLIAIFQSPQNIQYLRGVFVRNVPPGPLLDFALKTLDTSVHSFGEREHISYSDPTAQRGRPPGGAGLWPEVRRLNRAFIEYRLNFLHDLTPLLTKQHDDISADDEPYHYRMFVADSLRPPGYEHLNGAGPLYEILENQSTPRAAGREGFTIVPASVPNDPAVATEEWGWDDGDPGRTAEQAVAEAISDYWGEDVAEGRVDASSLRAAEAGGPRRIDVYGRGARWRENGGTRFMRYPTIPFWQNLSGGRDYDRDIEETLGTGTRELDSAVRRWDMTPLKKYRDGRFNPA